ncbi:MAG: hypothetical protein [Caudoviricetes sp.]|nr:MAG: hypothetical protein [Caudoviricetes sp.]
MKKPKVFVTRENPDFNYSPAEAFGEVVFLTDREFTGNPNSLTDQTILRVMDERLAEFDPLTDYIVLTGSPITIAYAGHKVLARNRPVQFLRWDNRAAHYHRVVFMHHLVCDSHN